MDVSLEEWQRIGVRQARRRRAGGEARREMSRVGCAIAILAACSHGGTPANQMFSQADAYDHFMGRWSRLVAPELVRFAGVLDGEAVLDVGSGTGVLSFALRDATKTGRIVGVDPSAEYVAHATRANHDARVQFQVGDAQQLKLDDASFERTMALLVMNFIPDRPRALQEMKRVTKPGGVIAAAVWDYGDGMKMLRVFWDEAIALDPAIEHADEAHMPLCKRGELAALWTAAGMDDVAESPIDITMHFASFDDYWEPFLLGQGPGGAYVAKLPRERKAALAARLRKRLIGDGPDHAFDLQARAWAVKGTVPARR